MAPCPHTCLIEGAGYRAVYQRTVQQRVGEGAASVHPPFGGDQGGASCVLRCPSVILSLALHSGVGGTALSPRISPHDGAQLSRDFAGDAHALKSTNRIMHEKMQTWTLKEGRRAGAR